MELSAIISIESGRTWASSSLTENCSGKPSKTKTGKGGFFIVEYLP